MDLISPAQIGRIKTKAVAKWVSEAIAKEGGKKEFSENAGNTMRFV